MKTLRIFVSSPGDVGREREIAGKVIARLKAETAGRVDLDPYFWEHEPMHAGTDFQGQIPPLADFAIFIGILWSRLGTRLHSSHTRPDGTTFASGTQFEFETALEAYRTSTGKTPRLLIYRRDETPLFPAKPADVLAGRTKQWEALEAFVTSWFQDPADGGTFRAAFNSYKNTAEFEQILEEHLRSDINALCPEARESTPIAEVPITWKLGSPYRGLEVFEFDHAAIFFGRTRAIDDVVGQLRDRANVERLPFVLIFGSSGSGKSSLLRAGVIPALVAGGIDGIGLWRRAVLQPSKSDGDLFDGLAAALLKPEAVPELAAGGRTAADLAARLRENASAVGEFLAGTLPQAAQRVHDCEKEALLEQAKVLEGESRMADAEVARRLAKELRFPEPRLILGLDQLEEIFTQEDRFPPASRVAFIDAIESLVRSGFVWVVATLRSDHFARCEEVPKLVKLQEGKGQYHLLAPSGSELAQIIRLPAQAAGVRFEDHAEKGRLEDVLRDAADDDPGALPLLEFTLEQLYAIGAADHILTHDEYASLGGKQGGLRGVLVKLADELHGKLSAEGKAAFPAVFRRLVSVGKAGPAASGAAIRFSRRNAKVGALRAGGSGAREVIDRFFDARLLITDQSDDGEEIVSVAHEALLNEWPLLRGMLEEDVAYLRRRERVAAAAAEWDREKRQPERLATSVLLAEARLVRTTEGADLSRIESDFVTLSVRLDHRRTVRWITGLAALVLVFGALAIWAKSAERKASEQKLKTQRILAFSDFARAGQLFESDEASAALAFLARSAESDPGGAAPAAERLWFALTQRHWPLPITPPMAHTDAIMTAVFNPAGTRILTASRDNTARLWDAATGALIGTPMAHPKFVRFAAFSPNGQRLVTICEDATARLWDARTATQIAGWIARHENSLAAAAFSASGRCVATGSTDKFAAVWDESSKRIALLKHSENVHALVFHPTDESLLLTVSGKTARLWKVANGTDGSTLREFAHPRQVNSAIFSPDGAQILTAADDGVQLWNTATGERAGKALPHKDPVREAIFSPDGRIIASLSGERILLWKHDAPTPFDEPLALVHRAAVSAMQFSSDNLRLVTGATDGRVQVWNVQNGQPLGEPVRERSAISAVAFSPEGKRLLSATAMGVARVWQTPPLPPAAIVLPHPGPVESVSVSADGKRLLTACGDQKARLWDPAAGKAGTEVEHGSAVMCAVFDAQGTHFATGSGDTVRVWTSPPTADAVELNCAGTVCRIAFSPDGTRLATGTESGVAQLYEFPSLRPVGKNPFEQSGAIVGLEFSRDSRQLLTTGAADPAVGRWNAATGEAAGEPLRGEREITCAAFGADGRIAAGSRDGTALLWSSAGVKLATLRHEKSVAMIALSSDGKFLITGADDGSAALWNGLTGSSISASLRHAVRVNVAAFSADGSRVATGSDDWTARIWDTATGQPISEPLRHEKPVRCLAFSPDGQTLFTGSADSTVRVWDLHAEVPDSSRGPLVALARALSSFELQPSGRLEPHTIEPLEKLRHDAGGGALAAWFFADPQSRALTPFSRKTATAYLEARINEGSESALAEAALLSIGDGEQSRRIEEKRKALLAP